MVVDDDGKEITMTMSTVMSRTTEGVSEEVVVREREGMEEKWLYLKRKRGEEGEWFFFFL